MHLRCATAKSIVEAGPRRAYAPSVSEIDRMAPTYRPEGNNAGTQRWSELLFLHWVADAEQLRPLVPEELELDTYEGKAYIGLVPFGMRDIKPSWLPKAMAFNFLETNVRTYVVHKGKPGVYFFSLDASSLLAVWAARVGWELPYFHASMREAQDGAARTYASHRGGGAAALDVTFRPEAKLGESVPDTLEHFLLERYLLFVKKKGRIHVGQVHHAPYEGWTATVDDLSQTLVDASGLHIGARTPDLVHYSPGVDVEVFAIVPS